MKPTEYCPYCMATRSWEGCGCHAATAVVRTDLMDSVRWSRVPLRTGDVVIATFGKSGTTWVQQIIGQLIYEGCSDLSVGDISPWIEYRGTPSWQIFQMLRAQPGRRFVKTHLPMTALPYCTCVRYIFVARDPKDQIWSAYNHLSRLGSASLMAREKHPARWRMNTLDLRSFYKGIFDPHAADVWPFWSHVMSWWKLRHRPNVLLLHYMDLHIDVLKAIRQIAEFLDISLSADLAAAVGEYSSYEFMKRNAHKVAGPEAKAFANGPAGIFNGGFMDSWKGMLTEDDIALSDQAALKHLSLDCYQWLRGADKTLAMS